MAASDKDLLNSFSRIWYFNECFKFSTLGSTSQYGNLSQAMHLHYTFSEYCPNTGRYGPEITPYLDTFQAVSW